MIALIAKHYDFVVIDGEAGIEQINRRVMEKMSHLLLITDQSKKGRDVVKTIAKVASELVMYDEIGVIQNRLSPRGYGTKARRGRYKNACLYSVGHRFGALRRLRKWQNSTRV